MKLILSLWMTVCSMTVFGQNLAAQNLQWKIGKNEKLNYLCAMSDFDTGSVKFNFGGLFKALNDSSNNALNETQSIFKKFNDVFKNYDFQTTLSSKKEGIVDIVMSGKPKASSDDADPELQIDKQANDKKIMESMMQGVMLRGSVYAAGGIHSFWIKSAQKNLIALLFELPSKPVKIGDKWSIDVDLIANDQNFVCDSSYKINEVTLADIKTINGETIAILKYNIIEYVNGDFITPAFMNSKAQKTATMMKFAHQGIAEFSIDKGRWLSYNCIMSIEATGIMTVTKTTKFTLSHE